MENQSSQLRIKAIYQMLFEMATGNLAFRLDISGHHDELDRLSSILNLLANELQVAILQLGYVNPHYSYQSLVQATFVLNRESIITGFSFDVLEMFHYKSEDISHIEFGKLIAPQSSDLWNVIKSEAVTDTNYHNTIQLIFITGNKKLLSSFCTISRLQHSDKIIVTTVTTILCELIADVFNVNGTIQSKQTEAEILQNLYDYILCHLEQPLPTLKELAVLFDTNEYKLKRGFRKLFKTSIYNFYHEERLKRAHQLIQQTQLSLKQIALMCGFNTYMNFYKAFKKRFNYTPTEVERGKVPD